MSISGPRPGDPAKDALLRVAGLSAFYGGLQAIDTLDLALFRGDTLAVIGANGAGKSTLLRSLAGLMTGVGTTRISGTAALDGELISGLMPDAIVERGIALVPEGRRLFARMSVEDNLLCGAYLPRCRAGARARLDEIYSLFPRLRERRRQTVSQMSGGEQQMVAIGRALMSSPRLLLLDELSLGLSPAMVDDIYRKLSQIVGAGMTVIVVEQDLRRALGSATRFVVMLEGRIVMEGSTDAADEGAITAAYFGAHRGRPARGEAAGP